MLNASYTSIKNIKEENAMSKIAEQQFQGYKG